MSRWFRHYAGLARDEKLVRVAIHAEQPLERVVWVWVALLESAAEKNGDGEYDAFAAEMAYFLQCPKQDVEAILNGLEALGRISDGRIATWSTRQYKGDSSTERVKRYREARKQKGLLAQWQPSKELRETVYARDGYACVYCHSSDDLTIDHKTPEMHGGDNSLENLQTACRKCNAKKRDVTHEEFIARNGVTVSETRHRQKTETELVDANASTPRERASVVRGSRIPSDWTPTKPLPQTVSDLCTQWPPGRLERELDGFRDYWIARTRDAAKSDWDRAWWNRIRDQHDRVMKESRNGQHGTASKSGYGRTIDAALDFLADLERADPVGPGAQLVPGA